MPRPPKPRACPHTDRPIYAKGLCKSCYVQLVRNPKTTRKNNTAYEDRHREDRNRIRAERAKAKYWAAKSTSSKSDESATDTGDT